MSSKEKNQNTNTLGSVRSIPSCETAVSPEFSPLWLFAFVAACQFLLAGNNKDIYLTCYFVCFGGKTLVNRVDNSICSAKQVCPSQDLSSNYNKIFVKDEGNTIGRYH